MPKTTEAEKLILQKLQALEGPISSEDLSDLRPQTTREHLLVMLPIQTSTLKRLEHIEETLNNGLLDRVSRLETTWKVGGVLILGSLVGMLFTILSKGI